VGLYVGPAVLGRAYDSAASQAGREIGGGVLGAGLGVEKLIRGCRYVRS
jgi:hypothetical protein